MPKIDLDKAPAGGGSTYPAPFNEPCLGREWVRLGAAADLTQFGVNLVTLKPGVWSSQRHWHAAEDEFVFHVGKLHDPARRPHATYVEIPLAHVGRLGDRVDARVVREAGDQLRHAVREAAVPSTDVEHPQFRSIDDVQLPVEVQQLVHRVEEVAAHGGSTREVEDRRPEGPVLHQLRKEAPVVTTLEVGEVREVAVLRFTQSGRRLATDVLPHVQALVAEPIVEHERTIGDELLIPVRAGDHGRVGLAVPVTQSLEPLR